MILRPQSAVYKCIIPVKKLITPSEAIYHSLFRAPREKAREHPFPAWPEIDDPHQPCCLPTLLRAVYFSRRSCGDVIDIANRVFEYWKSIEHEIQEQLLAYRKLHPLVFWHTKAFGGLPLLSFGSADALAFPMKLGASVERVVEAMVQGVVYGNLDNFLGAGVGDYTEAFAYTHELSHRYAGASYGVEVLEELSMHAHKTLHRLATEERLSRGEIAKLWEEFWQTNDQIKSFVKKFEPIEEIFATYMGLRFLPPEVRNSVKPMIDKELQARNWYKAYEAFADSCDNERMGTPHEIALALLGLSCNLIESRDIDGAELLYKCVNILKFIIETDPDDVDVAVFLEQMGIPKEAVESAFEMCLDKFETAVAGLDVNTIKDMLNDGKQRVLVDAYIAEPHIWMFGLYSENIIVARSAARGPEPDEDTLSLTDRFFYESLRQQLNMRCGLVCPGPESLKKGHSCGWTKSLQRVYARLPKEQRRHFTLPN